QLPSRTTATRTRRTSTSSRCWRTLALAAATLSSWPACARLDIGFRPLVAHEDLVPEVLPDVAVELDEARLEADLGHVPRAGQIDLVEALDRPRPGGHHADAVRE